jgi:MFS family permease
MAERRSLGREFRLLWAGESVSMVGDRVTALVVPTMMIFALSASAFEVGLVTMAQFLAIPVLGLVAGALVDRWDRRGLLIACDLIRFLAILAIPVAFWLGLLTTAVVLICVVAVSAASVFFNIGQLVVVPAVVGADDLVRANSRLETSRTVSEVGGPAVAGGLYQALGVGALLIDAGSYLFSAGCIGAMKPCGGRTSRAEPVLPRLGRGIRLLWADKVLRLVTIGTLIANLGGPVYFTAHPLLAYRGLGMSAGTYGLVMSAAAIGAVFGAVAADRIAKRVGMGRMMAFAAFAEPAAVFVLLAAPAFPVVAVFAVSGVISGMFTAMYNISTVSVRQVRVAGRDDQALIHAAYRTLSWGAIPLGALAAGLGVGLLTEDLGPLDAARIVMVVGAVIAMLAAWPLAGVQSLIDERTPDPATVY